MVTKDKSIISPLNIKDILYIYIVAVDSGFPVGLGLFDKFYSLSQTGDLNSNMNKWAPELEIIKKKTFGSIWPDQPDGKLPDSPSIEWSKQTPRPRSVTLPEPIYKILLV